MVGGVPIVAIEFERANGYTSIHRLTCRLPQAGNRNVYGGVLQPIGRVSEMAALLAFVTVRPVSIPVTSDQGAKKAHTIGKLEWVHTEGSE